MISTVIDMLLLGVPGYLARSALLSVQPADILETVGLHRLHNYHFTLSTSLHVLCLATACHYEKYTLSDKNSPVKLFTPATFIVFGRKCSLDKLLDGAVKNSGNFAPYASG